MTERMKSLYLEERHTLRQIADQFGMSHQAVHYRLKKAGTQFRDSSFNKEPLAIDKPLLIQLYVDKRLSMDETAKRLGCSASKVLATLRQLGITRRNSGPRPTVYAAIYTMKLGQEVLVVKPNHPYPTHTVLKIGELLGFDLEVEVFDDGLLLVTRVD